MRLNELPAPPGRSQVAKRKGRGIGSGNGKTGGRGHKGQSARAGGYHKVGFEGGQMPLQRRLPKRGFKNPFRRVYALVSVASLDVFEAGREIRLEDLKEHGIVGKRKVDGVKLLAGGELTKALVVHVDRCSKSAAAKVEQAGGRVVVSQVLVSDSEMAG
ncbi:MAG: 50S ribosomal protein L15 [Magnetococcales bacterium]|nr:50S ribosomal protein L15 [Magnetococcales bacterium]